MRRIVWIDSALNDIIRLKAFLAKENPNAAKKAAQAIKEATEILLETPSLGKPVRDLPQYREVLTRVGAGGYVLRYRISDETIYILHVRHYREFDFKL